MHLTFVSTIDVIEPQFRFTTISHRVCYHCEPLRSVYSETLEVLLILYGLIMFTQEGVLFSQISLTVLCCIAIKFMIPSFNNVVMTYAACAQNTRMDTNQKWIPTHEYFCLKLNLKDL